MLLREVVDQVRQLEGEVATLRPPPAVERSPAGLLGHPQAQRDARGDWVDVLDVVMTFASRPTTKALRTEAVSSGDPLDPTRRGPVAPARDGRLHRRVIKYLGSKRVLVPVLGDIAEAVGARTAVDLFTGTTRVAQEFKRRGIEVTATDVASYSEVLSDCYVATDAAEVDRVALADEIDRLNALPGAPGYVTRTFCEESRYFQPHNGARIDAIRDAIERDHPDGPLRPMLLTSLLLAADRVDSTTGLQMAYLKQWSARSHRDLELKPPELLDGPGRTVRGDAMETVDDLEHVDLMYLDPPYNQHRYFTNYHVWETLVRWDRPDHYGIACKRIDARDDDTKSVFNRKRRCPARSLTCSAGPAPTCWWSPTTTSPGSTPRR